MVIDFHVHCFADELAERAVSLLAERAGTPPRLNGTVADVKKSMKEAGVDRSVILPVATKPSQAKKINDWAVEIQCNEITAFGSIHPDDPEWKQELRRIKGLGLKGIKFHPDYQLFYVDEERMFPIYEEIFALGLIVVFHAGVDIGLPAPYHCEPHRLLKLVKAFPGAAIVAAHMGGYSYWDDVERLLLGEDIYLDTAYSLGHMSDEQALRIINGHDSNKILFATDSPWGSQSEDIGKLKNLGLNRNTEKAILGENAKKLLEL